MPVKKQVVERIEKLRERAGMTCYELADKIGMSRAGYSRLVTGKTSDVRLSTLERIAAALDCDVKVILRKR